MLKMTDYHAYFAYHSLAIVSRNCLKAPALQSLRMFSEPFVVDIVKPISNVPDTFRSLLIHGAGSLAGWPDS